MRADPSLVASSGTNEFFITSAAVAEDYINGVNIHANSNNSIVILWQDTNVSGTAGQGAFLSGEASGAYVWVDSEL